jgi:signal transduction histidine kinase
MDPDRLRELLAINRVIAGSLDYEEVLRLVVEKAAELTGAERCALLLEDDAGRARIAAQQGIAEERVAAFSAPFDEKIDAALRKLLSYESHDAFTGVPVIHRGSVRGMLLASHRGPDPAPADEEALLSALADQAAIALDRASRYRELWRQSQEARRELELAARHKDEFLAMLAHELRNPLAAIVNAIEVLHARVGDDPHLNRVQDIASRQAMHMKRLLDDLLDVSRVTQGRIVLDRRSVDLRRLVHQAVQAVHPLIEERRHALHLELPRRPVFVDGDADRLVEVVSNLLTNAAKYSPPEGHIRVAMTSGGGWVEVRVADRGEGIAPELLSSIFDLFVQSKRGYHRTEGGLGIGLTLVRRLVEMHGGEVTAHSEGEGLGSELVVRLPTAAGQAPAADPGDEPAPAAADARRVLVVEDNRDVAEMMASLIELQGHRVTVAADGESALDRVREEMPEVMLVDIGLPKLDGYEVARHVRSRGGDQPILVAVTGYGTEQDQDKSRQAGFDHHLVKPVRYEQLLRVLGYGQ